MKFAFISTMEHWRWGGSEELWTQAALQLRREGHQVTASVVHWPELSEKFSRLSQHEIALRTHPSQQAAPVRRLWNKLSLSAQRSRNALQKFNPDLVVISQGYNAGGFSWARVCIQSSIPYVIIVHCNSENWWFQETELREAVASYTSARKVFCVSCKNLELLRLQLGEPLEQAEIVRNPYNVCFERAPDWPESNGHLRLACVARLDPAAKGQDILLQVLASAEWRARPLELNFFGAGPYDSQLRRMSEMLRLKNVHFRGHVSDVERIWKENHLLVLPSRYEGLPLSLVEAMRSARPAVVTDVGGNAELCLDEETGFVAEAATAQAFDRAMRRAWDRREEWFHLGEAARLRVEKEIPKDPVNVFCNRLKALVLSQ